MNELFATPLESSFSSTYVPIPFNDIMKIAEINSAAQQQAQAALGDYLKDSATFSSQSKKDMETYNALTQGRVRSFLDNAKLDPDSVKGLDFRNEVQNLVNTTDFGTLALLRKSAENMDNYRKNYDMRWSSAGDTSLSDMTFYDSTQGLFDKSPVQFQTYADVFSPIGKALNDTYLGKTKDNRFFRYGVDENVLNNALTDDVISNLMNDNPALAKRVELDFFNNPALMEQYKGDIKKYAGDVGRDTLKYTLREKLVEDPYESAKYAENLRASREIAVARAKNEGGGSQLGPVSTWYSNRMSMVKVADGKQVPATKFTMNLIKDIEQVGNKGVKDPSKKSINLPHDIATFVYNTTDPRNKKLANTQIAEAGNSIVSKMFDGETPGLAIPVPYKDVIPKTTLGNMYDSSKLKNIKTNADVAAENSRVFVEDYLGSSVRQGSFSGTELAKRARDKKYNVTFNEDYGVDANGNILKSGYMFVPVDEMEKLSDAAVDNRKTESDNYKNYGVYGKCEVLKKSDFEQMKMSGDAEFDLGGSFFSKKNYVKVPITTSLGNAENISVLDAEATKSFGGTKSASQVYFGQQ